jgi:branched-chain amino acid transport system substrate-binding protein
MVELNFKPPVMGTGMLDDPAIFELAGAAANGVYFTTSVVAATDATRKLSREFRAAFNARYKRDPGITANAFYDATRLAVDAIRAAGRSGPAIDKWIAGVKDYPSVTANISFTAIGDRILPITIKKIDDRKFVGTDLVRSPQ